MPTFKKLHFQNKSVKRKLLTNLLKSSENMALHSHSRSFEMHNGMIFPLFLQAYCVNRLSGRVSCLVRLLTQTPQFCRQFYQSGKQNMEESVLFYYIYLPGIPRPNLVNIPSYICYRADKFDKTILGSKCLNYAQVVR